MWFDELVAEILTRSIEKKENQKPAFDLLALIAAKKFTSLDVIAKG